MEGERSVYEFGQRLRAVHDAVHGVAPEHGPPDLAAADRALAAARARAAGETPAATPPSEVSAPSSDSEVGQDRPLLTIAAARQVCVLHTVRLRRENPQHAQLAQLATITAGLDRLANAGQTTLPVYIPAEGVRALSTDALHQGLTAALAHLPGPQPIAFDLAGAGELLRSWGAKLDSTKSPLAAANVTALHALEQFEAAGVSSFTALVAPGDFSIARLRAAHAGITAAQRLLELREHERAQRADGPRLDQEEVARASPPPQVVAPTRETSTGAFSPAPLSQGQHALTRIPRRSPTKAHELTLGELKEKCQNIVASLDRAVIEHERALIDCGAIATTKGSKFTWQLPAPSTDAELAARAYTAVGGEWLAAARAEEAAAQRELQLLQASQAKTGKLAAALIGWRMRDTKTKAQLARTHLAEVTAWLGQPEHAAQIAARVLALRTEEERNLALAREQLEQLRTVQNARKEYAALARELNTLNLADLRQPITLQGTTVNELVHDSHARQTLSTYVVARQQQRAFRRQAGLSSERGLSA